MNSEDQREIVENGGKEEGGRSRGRRGRRGRDRQSQSICGCGNVYSCSSALSLHIKNKHGGKVPQGSIGFPSANYRRKDHLSSKQVVSSNSNSQQSCQMSKKYIPNNRQSKHFQTQSYGILSANNQQNSSESNPANDIMGKHVLKGLDGPKNGQFDDEQLIDILNFKEPYQQTNNSENPAGSFPQASKVDQRRLKGNRQYVSKRIYLCGCCMSCFAFLQELMLHIQKTHNGDIPDGSIFGLKREYLLNYFHISSFRQYPIRKIYVFQCGCGKEYTCSSSLYYHIKTVHGGVEPSGTSGLVKPS